MAIFNHDCTNDIQLHLLGRQTDRPLVDVPKITILQTQSLIETHKSESSASQLVQLPPSPPLILLLVIQEVS